MASSIGTRALAGWVLGAAMLCAPPASAQETAPKRTEWRSPPIAIVGFVVTGVGVTAASVGTVSFLSSTCHRRDELDCSTIGRSVGALGWLAGAVHLAIGIPLIASGTDAVDPVDGRPIARARLTASPTRADFIVNF